MGWVFSVALVVPECGCMVTRRQERMARLWGGRNRQRSALSASVGYGTHAQSTERVSALDARATHMRD